MSRKALVALVSLFSVFAGVSELHAQSSGPVESWRTTIYPVYGWAPVFGADITLPEVPGGGGGGEPITPAGSVSSNFNGAAFAAVMVENRYVQFEANVLWAGLSASAERPSLEVNVDTILGSARAGVRVAPSLFVSGGVRRVALNVKARALDFDQVQWKPGIWEPLVGAAYTPHLSHRWRLLLRADYGGLGSDRHSTLSANGSIEWQPAAHFIVNAGYGLLKIEAEDTVANKTIRLDQTLHGPIVGIGIPF